MKLDLEFPEFQSLKDRMGARESSWRLSRPALNEREKLIAELEEGKEIPLEAVETSFGGLLSHKGEQVVLYIKDTRQDQDTLIHDAEKAKKFHISECEALQRMRREGRFDRYVVSRRKDGKFKVEATDSVEEIEAPLPVCRYCLSKLDWKGYASRGRSRAIWKNFSLQDFFAEFATFFASKPQYSDETAPKGGYAKDWHQIATTIKQQRNWQCDKCGVNLSNHQSLLHGHHKNGVVSDNRPSNIDVLCFLCHSEQPAHQWMRPSITEKLRIKELRRQQQEKRRQNQTGDKVA